MKKRSVQIVTILFALSLLFTYVVHSQLAQQTPTAPGSKSLAPVVSVRPASVTPASNRPPPRVAPGSKSAPVFDLRSTAGRGSPGLPAATTNAPGSDSIALGKGRLPARAQSR
jgi:hypothetical protein